jgi:serine/threonine protein kinase
MEYQTSFPPPEYINLAGSVYPSDTYDTRCADVFALGNCILICLTGYPLAHYQKGRTCDLRDVLLNATQPQLGEGVLELLQGMMCSDIKLRWTMNQVARHAWAKATDM